MNVHTDPFVFTPLESSVPLAIPLALSSLRFRFPFAKESDPRDKSCVPLRHLSSSRHRWVWSLVRSRGRNFAELQCMPRFPLAIPISFLFGDDLRISSAFPLVLLALFRPERSASPTDTRLALERECHFGLKNAIQKSEAFSATAVRTPSLNGMIKSRMMWWCLRHVARMWRRGMHVGYWLERQNEATTRTIKM
jgi:hypothetical protein